MIIRADKLLEEQPRSPGDQTKGSDIARRELDRFRDGGRKADLATDPWSGEPQRDEGGGDPGRVRLQRARSL